MLRSIHAIHSFYFILLIMVAPASYSAEKLPWDALSAQEQKSLLTYRKQWDQLAVTQQRTLRRWAKIPVKQRNHIKQRYEQWQALSPKQREKIARQLKRFNIMPPERQRRIKAWRQWVDRLPKREQVFLHKNWSKMTRQQRKQHIQILRKKYGS